MADLKLKVGDRVRNINHSSNRLGWQGVVIRDRLDSHHNFYPKEGYYHVRYDNGELQSYSRSRSSQFLERADLHRQTEKQLRFAEHYALDLSKLEQILLAKPNLWGQCFGASPTMVVHDEIQFTHPNRRTLKKVRRNVLTGKTQDDMVKLHGHAQGVHDFNTRALGRTTGQVFSIIGEAMCNPGKPINTHHVDHWIHDARCNRGASREINRNFSAALKHAVAAMKGFTFTETTITFNPIVTEETYVEIR